MDPLRRSPLALPSRLLSALFLLVFLAWSEATAAHEVRPAYLEITETSQGYIVVWKVPVGGTMPSPLAPVLSNGALSRPPDRRIEAEDFAISEWRLPADVDLAGQTISVSGLDRGLNDALIRFSPADGRPITQVVQAGQDAWVLPDASGGQSVGSGFVALGVEHILAGLDHLAFVAGLMLLVRSWSSLVTTITAFTVGHSLTLGLAVVGYVHVDSSLVECLIALSILVLAVEIVHAENGRPTLAASAPWLVALGFGLLHGLGFAGAITQTGLPDAEVAPALFAFNVGVELGQLTFVATVIVAVALLRRLVTLPAAAASGAAYGIGTMSAYWLFERLGAHVS